MPNPQPEPFTIGVYEDKWAYLLPLASAARDLVSDGVVERARIIWYRLDRPLHEWAHDVAAEKGHMNPNPFAESPFCIDVEPSDEGILLPGEGQAWTGWTGQRDIPEDLIAEQPTPGKFWVARRIPEPNLIVVDHELFRGDAAFVSCPGEGDTEGHAHLIVRGLGEYYENAAHTPPIFLSSVKPLGGSVGLDTL